MSVYGYSQELNTGNMYSARTRAFNDGVRAHNQIQTDKYKTALKNQIGDITNDNSQRHTDEAVQGVERGEGVLATGAALTGEVSGVAKNGVGYFKLATEQRLNTMGSTARKLVAGKDIGKAAEVTQDPADLERVARLNTFGTGEKAQAAFDALAPASKKALVATQGLSGVAKTTGTVVEAGVQGSEAGETIESSGLGAAVIKAGLKKVPGVASGLGEAGLSTVSEVGGKALGAVGGAVDLGSSIDNLIQGKSWFGTDDTKQKWGDSLQEAGAAMDIVGTAFPPLELLGGIVGLVGAGIDSYDEIKKDIDKKKSDAATIHKPAPDKIKVSPTYQSLGLVASAPISSKTLITGSSTF